ncbi:O-antigen ligase family protein [Paenibacillus methanolicus]|uniref:O-antigen ligase n=1 Tax=Paenibacillus methanolicus TaxID=582686 RepID=A0A5S5BTB7_9BACL|nr:O-antigen ligase family protein [Paenibacillus methanolicus]TYP70279.1 O-antigen ligase [Paenibacillus methanolicus]
MNFLIVLSVILSLTSGMYSQFATTSSISLTLLPVIIIMAWSILRVLKDKRIQPLGGHYLIIFLAVTVLVVGMFKTGLNSTMLKVIIYYVFLLILANEMTNKSLNLLYKLMLPLGLLMSIDIFYAVAKVKQIGFTFNSLRAYTLMDKQYIGTLFLVAIPVAIWHFVKKKSIFYLALSVLFIVTSILFMQIKTLILALGLSFFVVMWVFRVVPKIKLAIVALLTMALLVVGVTTFKQHMPSQIVAAASFILGDTSEVNQRDLKYVDTVAMRQEIKDRMMDLFKENYMLGIGFGNYAKLDGGLMKSAANPKEIIQLPNASENGMLSFLVEGGILSTLMHVVLLVYLIFQASRIRHVTMNVLIGFTVLIAFVISNFVQDNTYFFTYWFFIAVGIYHCSPKGQREQEDAAAEEYADSVEQDQLGFTKHLLAASPTHNRPV